MKIMLEDAGQVGIKLCKDGHWDEGLVCLKMVTKIPHLRQQLPTVALSYMGYGIAKRHGLIEEGLTLCQKALEDGFYDADNFYNLARLEYHRGHRKEAMKAVASGLRLDPHHTGLHKLQKQMGVRRRPVLRFLKRSNPINVLLGRLRHAIA